MNYFDKSNEEKDRDKTRGLRCTKLTDHPKVHIKLTTNKLKLKGIHLTKKWQIK